MKRTLLVATASLALAVPAGLAIAQDATVAAEAAAHVMTDAQQGIYATWPADRQASYKAWPSTHQAYFWTLTPEQQDGWWALTDEQRARVYAMTPEQRTAAWASIMAQMKGAAANTAADTSMSSTTAMPAGSGDMQFVRKETAQPVAADADPAALASGDVPVCKKGQQDGCINAWEKNKRGNKPLGYWPGKPASETPAKKPEPQ